MTARRDESEIIDELEGLLVAIVLGDATEAELCRLNDLLQCEDDLRQRASRFLEEEAVLRHLFQVLGRVSDYHCLPAGLAEGTCTPAATTASRVNSCRRRFARLFFAASLAAMVVGSVLWPLQERREGTARRNAEDTEQGPLAAESAPMAAVFSGSVMLPRVTKVSWAGPHFTKRVPTLPLKTEPLSVGMQEGVARFTSVQGRPAEGYMVHLPPDALMDLVVSADAAADNALAVIEFDSDGQPTGRKISFTNSLAEGTMPGTLDGNRPAAVKLGPLGVLTDHNDNGRSRYYLFTCVHKKLNQSVKHSWHVSQLSVILQDNHFAHIGWDDSGMLRETDGELIPDEDFDDISATIRIYGRETNTAKTKQALRILTTDGQANTGDAVRPDDTVALGSDGNLGLPFAVAPGAIAVLKVTNRTVVPIAITVVEHESGRICWSCAHLQPRFVSTGICALENNTARAQQFRLVCRYQPANARTPHSWQVSDHKVLFQQDSLLTVGLKYGMGEPDLENLKVDIITMGKL